MKIYISHCSQDKDFADTLLKSLRKANEKWEVISYWDKEQVGADYKELVSKMIRDSDAFIAVISNQYNESKYALMELYWALAYNYENQFPFIMPIIVNDAEVPYDLTQKLYLRINVKESKSEYITLTQKVTEALMNLSVAKKEKKAVALSEMIAVDGTQFIEETVGRLKKQTVFNRIMGFFGYALCFISLLSAIVFSVSKTQIITGQTFDVADNIRLGLSTGVCAILDCRANDSGAYRRHVLNTLPNCRVTSSTLEIEQFIQAMKPQSYFMEGTICKAA